MNKLEKPIEISVFGTDRILTFSTPAELAKWADSEVEAWMLNKSNVPQLQTYLDRQASVFNNISAQAKELIRGWESEENDARSAALSAFVANTGKNIGYIRNGTAITTDHANFSKIAALNSIDPDASILMLAASYGDGRERIRGLVSQNLMPWDSFIQLSLSADSREAETSSALKRIKRESDQLRTRLERAYAEFAEHETAWVTRSSDAVRLEGEATEARDRRWGEFLRNSDEQWKSALRTYDEKMALAAPTTYWSNRATGARNSAMGYGAAFAVIVTIGLILFGALGIPYLSKVSASGTSVIVAILPVLVPAFAAVWLLRIVGRLLSESLQLIQDARERETMVKTFLALMNDEVRGKALVTDNDRLLILHALFRPSAVSGTDDAPPVNWFDILSQKMGDQKK